jgi:tyrosyl-tRNA synthetase
MSAQKVTGDTDEKKIDEVLARGVKEVIRKDELRAALRSGEVLRVKLGIDPTSPHIHLGRAVLLLKLRDFQKLGHKVVLIIGDATGVIGDASDKESERPMLTKEHIEGNSRTYFAQAGRILNLEAVEKHYNSEWLSTLTYKEIGEHANQFSLADFIARENIKRRLEAGKRVSLREVLYPLMQGYDSVAVSSHVEIGGTDQRFNLLAGRTLQMHLGQKSQHILLMNLISGTDGRKMSSSWGNVINISDDPFDMYGKIMSLKDSLMEQYFVSLTRVPMEEVKSIISEEHPKRAKMRLAREILSLLYGGGEAERSEEHFEKTFALRQLPPHIPEVVVKKGTPLSEALKSVISSKSELRRLVKQGAIENKSGGRITDADMVLSREMVLKIGKKRFLRVKVNNEGSRLV